MTVKEAKARCNDLRDAIKAHIPDGPARCLAEAMLDRVEAHMVLAIKQGKWKQKP